jgi:opacity protein-like surface antigen
MRILFGIILLFILQYDPVLAQDQRTQYPGVLSKGYFGIDIGYIDYKFSNAQLNTGFTNTTVTVPHTAVRVTLLGYRFSKYLSAELNYMRPVLWVRYHDINNAPYDLPVYMNFATIVARPVLPITNKFSLKGEVGLAIVTRRGFDIDRVQVLNDANYISASLGAGVSYYLNQNWEFALQASYSPQNKDENQPATAFYSVGFKYNMHALPEHAVERNASSGYRFPHQMVQFGLSTNSAGYGTNKFVSKDAHIFWGGDAQVESGVALQYQRNIFHTRKVFSLDWGANICYWKSNKEGINFYTLSLFPLFRFTLIRTKPVDFYLDYSVAGPSYISRIEIDSLEIGKRFTFQDFMGIGSYFGKKRNMNAEVRIAHYSNGNLFPQNEGVMIPLTFNVGYTW